MEKIALILFLVMVTTGVAFAAPSDTSGPWVVDAAGFKNLSTALASPATVGQTVVVSKPMAINSMTVTGNRTVRVLVGGRIDVAAWKTLFFAPDSSFDAGRHQVFNGSGRAAGLSVAFPEWWGAAPGVQTDSAGAIMSAANSGGIIQLQRGRVYWVSTIDPPANFVMQCNGATLKSLKSSNMPIFYDSVGSKSGFTLIDAVLDGNQANNQANLTGGVWLTNWTNIHLRGQTRMSNMYREGVNLFRCKHVRIDDYEFYNSGLASGPMPNMGYGMTLNQNTSDVFVGNLYIHDVVGFGLHVYTGQNCTFGDVKIVNMVSPSGIGITLTNAVNTTFNNIAIDTTNGDAFESNSSQNVTVNSIRITGAGNRAFLFGNNRGLATGYNDQIKINNVILSNTTNAEIAGTHIKNVEFNNLQSDSAVSISMNTVEATNARLLFVNSNIQMPTIDRTYIQCINCYLTDKGTHADKTETSFRQRLSKTTIANGAAFNFSLSNNGGMTRVLRGKIKTIIYYPSSPSQFTWKEENFIYSPSTSSIATTAISALNGTAARALTYSMPATTTLTATNNSGVDLSVIIEIDQQL